MEKMAKIKESSQVPLAAKDWNPCKCGFLWVCELDFPKPCRITTLANTANDKIIIMTRLLRMIIILIEKICICLYSLTVTESQHCHFLR